MKKKLILVALSLCCSGLLWAKGDNFYANPLLLNGRPLDLKAFSAASRGILTFVKGDPYGCNLPKVPFVIYLKRGNEIINLGASSSTREVYEIEVSSVLGMARFGDELVIMPARPSDQHAKQVIRLTKFLQNLFKVYTKAKDEC